MSLSLSQLIAHCGDDKVEWQNLDTCATDLNYGAKSGTKITFGTEQPIGLDGTKKLGLVVWLDRETVKDAVAKARAQTPSGDPS